MAIRITIVGVVAALTLSGCGDDAPAGVLQPDDLPEISYAGQSRGMNAVATCSAISEVESRLTVADRPNGVMMEYRLGRSGNSGDYVISQALGVPSTYRNTTEACAAVESAIDMRAEPDGRESVTSFTGLTPGVIGYRSETETTTSSGPRIGERVFAVQGDRIIAVGVQHDGAGEPTVDVTELLPVALERAADAFQD